jgi:hypothetical protein
MRRVPHHSVQGDLGELAHLSKKNVAASADAPVMDTKFANESSFEDIFPIGLPLFADLFQ